MPREKVQRPKKFQCEECSLQFSELRILNEHKNIHSNYRPFICEDCAASFHNSANLRYHRKRHTNPNGFKCSVCSENFVNQQSLKKHFLRQHVEVNINPNRFQCTYADCGSTFKYEDLLKQHIRKIHHRVIGEFVCEVCNFVTNNKQNYYQHRRRLHDIRNRKGNRVFPASVANNQMSETKLEFKEEYLSMN
jgi:KRAB domain-containing zinc finger protein